MYDNKSKQNNQTRSKQISNPAGATSTPHAAGHIVDFAKCSATQRAFDC